MSVASVPGPLVGRQAETAALDALLADARASRGRALVARGEAGVGKSALLDYARSASSGMTVLRGTAIEGESELPYAALHQILRPLLDRIERLPEPQAAALRAAFALSAESVQERFRVSLGALGLLSDAAGERPLLCLIDDAQWLDHASADTLLFVARRLEVEPLAFVFAVRDGDTRTFEAPGLPELRVPPLNPADARTLVRDRLDASVAAGVVEWLVDHASGNPLALVELPGTLTSRQLTGHEPLAAAPATTSVEQVFLERVRALPAAAQALLLLAAAEETGARAAVERAAQALALDPSALTVAEGAGLVRVDSEHVVFRHPLVRSAVYRGAGFSDRERAHRTLADTLTAPADADRRAWHRAAGTVGRDDRVAEELEQTAERARRRSGYAAAAAALERAAELTDDPASRARRLVRAVAAAWHGGEPTRALALVERASPLVEDAQLRGELEHVRGDIEQRRGSLVAAGSILLAGASTAAPVDRRRTLEMLFDAASCGMQSGDYSLVGAAGEQAAALPPSDNERERFLADLLDGVGSLWLGASVDKAPLVMDVIGRAEKLTEPRLLTGAAMGASTLGEEASETALLARALRLARESGEVDAVTLALLSTAVAGVLAGRFTVVAEATEGLHLARESGLIGVAALQLAILTWFAAARGRDEECLAGASHVGESALATGNALAYSIAEWGVGLLETGRGRQESAAARLAALAAAGPGRAHPLIIVLAAPDLVEALVRAGRASEAHEAFRALESFTGPGAPPWALASAARCHALLGSDGEAQADFEAALRLHADANRPFDHARTALLYGEFLRRLRRRQDAREHLRLALEGFERLRAEPWAERARTELRATGETARKRDSGAGGELTPQETQVARLVSAGLSNKDVAAQLFLSPRTVEYHLRKVFQKLGIASRAELIRQGAGTELAGEPV